MGAHATTDPDVFSFPENKLVANVEEKFTFATSLDEVEVTSSGDDTAYFTVDGSAPEIDGDKSHRLPRVPSSRTVDVPGDGPTVVRVISSGTPMISVQRP